MEKDEKFKRADLEDGIYTNTDATFFVKDGRILMKLRGKEGVYKTTKTFMLAATRKWDLDGVMQKDFDPAYEAAPNW